MCNVIRPSTVCRLTPHTHCHMDHVVLSPVNNQNFVIVYRHTERTQTNRGHFYFFCNHSLKSSHQWHFSTCKNVPSQNIILASGHRTSSCSSYNFPSLSWIVNICSTSLCMMEGLLWVSSTLWRCPNHLPLYSFILFSLEFVSNSPHISSFVMLSILVHPKM